MKHTFTIDSDKLAKVARIYSARTGDNATATIADITGVMLDNECQNADEHQEWLDTAGADEIASWLVAAIFDDSDNAR